MSKPVPGVDLLCRAESPTPPNGGFAGIGETTERRYWLVASACVVVSDGLAQESAKPGAATESAVRQGFAVMRARPATLGRWLGAVRARRGGPG